MTTLKSNMLKLILSFVAVLFALTAFAEKKPEMMSWDDAYTRATEVVQLYVSENNPTVLRPNKELKAFKKVHLEAGKSAVVELELKYSDLAFWDVETHAWKVNPGAYTLHIGNSSANISQTLTIEAQ